MVQWSASATRMRSRALSSIFEGQRLASLRCSACNRCCASGAEPFTVEEVKLREESNWLGQIQDFLGSFGQAATPTNMKPNSSLPELLRECKETPAPEGYRCLNSRCSRMG